MQKKMLNGFVLLLIIMGAANLATFVFEKGLLAGIALIVFVLLGTYGLSNYHKV
jgi:hypothetical protein